MGMLLPWVQTKTDQLGHVELDLEQCRHELRSKEASVVEMEKAVQDQQRQVIERAKQVALSSLILNVGLSFATFPAISALLTGWAFGAQQVLAWHTYGSLTFYVLFVCVFVCLCTSIGVFVCVLVPTS